MARADSSSAPANAATVAQRLIAENDCCAILGAFASALTLAISEVTERRGVPLITMSCSDLLTSRGFRNVFQVTPKGSVIGMAQFNMATDLVASAGKVSKVAILFEGHRINGLKPHQVCRRGKVKTFQNVALFPDLTVMDNVLTGGLLRLSLADARSLARVNLEKVGMAQIADKRAADLTFPEKALVEMARALCTQPKVVLLDEVMAALNETEMDHVLALIRRLRQEEGLSFVVIEHHMRAIMNLCERIVVLCFGQKIAESTSQQISHNPEVISAYLGHDMAAQTT